jgi:hypothetical protein
MSHVLLWRVSGLFLVIVAEFRGDGMQKTAEIGLKMAIFDLK